MQKPLYFQSGRRRIAGTLHLPAGRRPCPAVALLHGFTGDKCEAHFIFVRLSRRLAAEGIASLRFDFAGSGESEGAFEEMTPLTELADARAALAQLRAIRRVDAARLGVVGLSIGGLVAALLAGEDASVRSLVLWSAVARPSEVIFAGRTQAEIQRLHTDGRFDIGGLYISKEFVDALASIDPPAALSSSKAATLIVHGTADETVPFDHSDDFLSAGLSRSVRTERLAVEGADHTYSGVEWSQKVIEATTSFLKGTLS